MGWVCVALHSLRGCEWPGCPFPYPFSGPPFPLPLHLAVVDTVWNPATPEDFPGLYCTSLPEQPFLPGSHTLLLTTQWRRCGMRRAGGGGQHRPCPFLSSNSSRGSHLLP